MDLFRYRVLMLSGAALASIGAGVAVAGPNGGTVVGGSATIQGQGTGSVTINQSSQNTIINWATFNIGKGETTTFNQPNSSSVALNRVIGGQGPSFLDGTLTANGRVFIVNGDGILFGANSSINTAGFLATTNDIRNEDFMAGKYNFNIPGLPNASIVNLGTITATSGGFAALVAPGVRNSGTITATLGTVSLAAGNAFTLDFYGDRLITLAVNDQIAAVVKDVQTGETLKSLVGNSGKLSANGGRVELTAAAARAVVDSVINNTGVIEANSIGTQNGMIVLGAATGREQARRRADPDRQARRPDFGRRQGQRHQGRHRGGHGREYRAQRRHDRRLRAGRRRQGADRRRYRRRQSQPGRGHDRAGEARILRDPDRHHGERGRRLGHQRLGDRQGQWRQGRAVVGSADHLRGHDPGARRRQRRQWRVRRDLGPSDVDLHRHRRSERAERSSSARCCSIRAA